MKIIPPLLTFAMLAVSGWAEDGKPEPYSPELVKRAEAGEAKAQIGLAECYGSGAGVAKDEKEAVKWVTKAAEQGDAVAQCTLGGIYYHGLSVA